MKPAISSLEFFATLLWIDGTPLVIEPYRQEIFRRALDTYRDDGVPQYNFVLAGRGKKNNKSLDLILASIYSLLFREDPRGSDVLIVANDEDQAGQDLDLAKKLIAANPDLADELDVLATEIRRKDGKGTMFILPANNVAGQHGKTGGVVAFDEIHAAKTYDLFEALAPDPTRYCLTWVTSYDTVHDEEGVPLYDFKKTGFEGSDDRMLFSWYSGDLCTDADFVALPPEERANPSMASWPEGKAYLDQQRRRLPSNKFRRLHLNLPGSPKGAFFDQNIVESAIVRGRQLLEPQDGIDFIAFTDMSGGSNDDATLAIAHWNGSKAILDLVINQGEPTPFNPRLAVAKFATVCKRYRCKQVHGDAYAGETFRRDFADCGIEYIVEKRTRTDWYEALEVALNAGQVELLELPKLRREILTIVQRGASLDHMPGQHDDWATSAAGALTLVNPDIGRGEPGMLEFYRRQSEAAAQQSMPTMQQEHAGRAVLQIGSKPQRPADFVKVAVPTDASHIITVSGASHLTESEDGQCVVWCSEDDAFALIASPFASPLWFEANSALLAQLRAARRGQRPPPWVGMTWSAMTQGPRSPFDRAGIAADALRAIGRMT